MEVIERNNFSQIPESTTVKGFIRNYAQFLGLPVENVLAVFRRDFCEDERGQVIPRGKVLPLSEKKFSWTPKLTLLTALLVIGVFLGFFLVRLVTRFSSAPPLQVFSPTDNQVFKEKVIVSGKTDKEATVKIDGSLIPISEDGSFKEEIVLPRGENLLTIESANRQGKKRVVNVKIRVE